MNKEGISQPMEWIVALFFIGLVIAFFLFINFAVKDNTAHNLKVEAIDYASTKDVVSISPDKIHFVYTLKPGIIINSKEQCLIESKTEVQKYLPVKVQCSRQNINIQEIFEKNRVILEKS